MRSIIFECPLKTVLRVLSARKDRATERQPQIPEKFVMVLGTGSCSSIMFMSCRALPGGQSLESQPSDG